VKPAVLTEEHAEHLGNSEDELSVGRRWRSCSFMYSPNRSVRFWEQEGQRRCSGPPKGLKTLQLKGRAFSFYIAVSGSSATFPTRWKRPASRSPSRGKEKSEAQAIGEMTSYL